jgi:ABC-type sugar transport system substrate-binding protein
MKPRQLALLLVVLIVPALVLAACGGDDDPTGTATQEGGTGSSTEAAETLVPEPPTTPPTEIGITTPLKKAPPTGKKVTFLQCEFPLCEKYARGMTEATDALGWDLTKQVFKSTEPEKALEQAIAGDPDYIAITGIPAQLLKPQLAEAEAAGIEVLSCAAATPEAAGEEFAADCGKSLSPPASQARDWMINDGNGEAHIVGVTIPQYPVLATESAVFEGKGLTGPCPECSYAQVEVTPEELAAGGVPKKIVAHLQANPDVNYVFLQFGDLATGLYAALQGAGLADQVKITGVDGNPTIMQEIGGEMDAWTAEGQTYSAWVMVDGMARLANDEVLTSEYKEAISTNPAWMVDSKESAGRYLVDFEWLGPENYQGQFEELWQLTD